MGPLAHFREGFTTRDVSLKEGPSLGRAWHQGLSCSFNAGHLASMMSQLQWSWTTWSQVPKEQSTSSFSVEKVGKHRENLVQVAYDGKFLMSNIHLPILWSNQSLGSTIGLCSDTGRFMKIHVAHLKSMKTHYFWTPLGCSWPPWRPGTILTSSRLGPEMDILKEGSHLLGFLISPSSPSQNMFLLFVYFFFDLCPLNSFPKVQSVALAVVRTPSSEHPEPLAAFESAALWRHPPWWINAEPRTTAVPTWKKAPVTEGKLRLSFVGRNANPPTYQQGSRVVRKIGCTQYIHRSIILYISIYQAHTQLSNWSSCHIVPLPVV